MNEAGKAEVDSFVSQIMEGNKEKEARASLLDHVNGKTDTVKGFLFNFIQNHDISKCFRTGEPVFRDDVPGTIDAILEGLKKRLEASVAAAPR